MSGGADPASSEALLARLRRDTVWAGLVLAVAALGLWPGQPARAAGVLGGLVLIGLSYAGLRAGVDAALGHRLGAVSPAERPEIPGDSPASGRSRGFVKFFTRHAILALGAYVMIARFELHPVAMLVGVTTPVVAAGIEFVRIVRARGTGSQSRSL